MRTSRFRVAIALLVLGTTHLAAQVATEPLPSWNDGPGKPVGIHRFIGRRPVMAFGNSDGDLQMLQWTTVGTPTSGSSTWRSPRRPGMAGRS